MNKTRWMRKWKGLWKEWLSMKWYANEIPLPSVEMASENKNVVKRTHSLSFERKEKEQKGEVQSSHETLVRWICLPMLTNAPPPRACPHPIHRAHLHHRIVFTVITSLTPFHSFSSRKWNLQFFRFSSRKKIHFCIIRIFVGLQLSFWPHHDAQKVKASTERFSQGATGYVPLSRPFVFVPQKYCMHDIGFL